MKKNLPITNNEVVLDDNTAIMSTTDLKGALTYINQEFLDISGFTTDELIGKNHNVIRHPEMPSAAFENLWATLKSGKAWMGLVKNRCKNGDYYWVDAFVTPLAKNGEITGYESTRVKPSSIRIKSVTALYKKINAGKKLKLKSLSFLHKQILTGSLFQLFIFTVLSVMGLLSFAVAAVAWVGVSLIWAGISYYQLQDFQKLLYRSKTIVNNPLMQLAYYGKVDDVSQIRLSIRMMKSKLRAVVKRIMRAAEELSEQAQNGVDVASASNASINAQKQELEMVATAVNEMTAAVQEVTQSTGNAAQATQEASDMARKGALTITDAIGIIDSLDSNVSTASSSISQLKEDSENIGGVLDVIRSIAEQTNLLALNAAIEAARAGEQGRGFAVVADEVRALASRSHDATKEIQEMIEKLQQGVAIAVSNMDEVSKRAEEGVVQVEESAEALAEMSGSVAVINDMNTHIAAATEEQSAVAGEVSQNIEHINQLSSSTAQSAQQMQQTSESLTELALELRSMVEQLNEES
ncbi:MAG: PAS domain-containing methyl-accepting chemotaxis protein [Woeseiaceae bacterium]